jgi:hypothetical protein
VAIRPHSLDQKHFLASRTDHDLLFISRTPLSLLFVSFLSRARTLELSVSRMSTLVEMRIITSKYFILIEFWTMRLLCSIGIGLYGLEVAQVALARSGYSSSRDSVPAALLSSHYEIIAKIPKSRYRHTWVTLLPGTLGGKPGHT